MFGVRTYRVMPRLERLLRRCSVDDNGCWLWQGHVSGGYGVARSGAEGGHRLDLVHRLVYLDTVGDIPDGYEVDHLCRVTRCCNPGHLEAVPPEENRRRADEARGPLCGRGLHDLTDPGNRRASGKGCRRCKADRAREQRQREKVAAH